MLVTRLDTHTAVIEPTTVSRFEPASHPAISGAAMPALVPLRCAKLQAAWPMKVSPTMATTKATIIAPRLDRIVGGMRAVSDECGPAASCCTRIMTKSGSSASAVPADTR